MKRLAAGFSFEARPLRVRARVLCDARDPWPDGQPFDPNRTLP